MPRGLSHVEIYTSDLVSAAAFWDWLLPQLGFAVYQEWPDGKSWRCGDTYLVCVQAEEAYRDVGFHRKRPGLNHLAFFTQSGEHLVGLTEKLRAAGVTVLYEDRPADDPGRPDAHSAFFEGPDRLKIELVAPQD